VIVGSSLKHDGVMEKPVDPARVHRFMDAVRAARETAVAKG
jgi:predicted TIM-barrel enzyme